MSVAEKESFHRSVAQRAQRNSKSCIICLCATLRPLRLICGCTQSQLALENEQAIIDGLIERPSFICKPLYRRRS
jgi:hypothetical protein